MKGCKGDRGSATESRSWKIKHIFHITFCVLFVLSDLMLQISTSMSLFLGVLGYRTAHQGKVQWDHYYSSCKYLTGTLKKVATWSYGKVQRASHPNLIFDDRNQISLPRRRS